MDTDRRFAQRRAAFDRWAVTQDADSLAGLVEALREHNADARVFFRGFVHGVLDRKSGQSRAPAVRPPPGAGDDDPALAAAFEQFALGYLAGYCPDDAG